MRDHDRDTRTSRTDTSIGTSELKAVASEALLIGKRYALGARQWINQRKAEMAQRDGDHGGEAEQGSGQRARQTNREDDYGEQGRQRYRYGPQDHDGGGGHERDGSARAGEAARAPSNEGRQQDRGSSDPGARGPSDQYGHGGDDRDGWRTRSGQDMQYPRGSGWQGDGLDSGASNTQASDQLPDGRYAGQANAQRGGQGQGRQWRSEYNNQPEVRQGDARGGGPTRGSAALAQEYAREQQVRGQQGSHDPAPQRHGGHRGRGPRGYSRSDERITEDLCARLTDDPLVDASEMSVEVRQGVAILTGTVEERWMKHHVEDLAERCSGVKDVDNQVRVQRSSGASGSALGQSAATASSDARGLGPTPEHAGEGQASGASSPTADTSSSGSGSGSGGASGGVQSNTSGREP